jgi:hypothetical protein
MELLNDKMGWGVLLWGVSVYGWKGGKNDAKLIGRLFV